MKYIVAGRQHGVGLIEVMVGLFILAFGLIALAMFSNRLFNESAESKTRLEAMQLAQQKIEEIRDVANAGDLTSLTALVESNVPFQGQNTTFSRSTSEDSTAAPVVGWTVTVSWVDSSGDNQSLSLETEVQLVNLAALAALGEGSLGGGGNIDLPIGVAKYGEAGEQVAYTDADKVNGVAIVIDEQTKTKYVVLADGSDQDQQVLVKIENYTSGNTSNDFALINGSVYVHSDVLTFGDNSFNAVSNLLLVRPSDVGICPWHMNDSGEVEFTSTANASVTRLDYTCYVGAGWYGNLAVINPDTSLDLAGSNNRTCGGDPDAYQVADDGGLTSHTPQLLSARREYRGYKVGYGIDQATPLIDADGNRIYLPVGIIGGDLYGKSEDLLLKKDYLDGYSKTEQRHDFYLQDIRLNGNYTTADEQAACNTAMVGVDADNEFVGNAGSFVCLYGDAGQSDIICPYVQPATGETVTASPVTMTGNIQIEGESPNLADIALKLALVTSQDETCDFSVPGADSSWIQWNCTVYIPDVAEGLSGTWTGNISLTADESLDICGASLLNIISATSDNFDYSADAQFIVSSDDCTVSGLYRVSGMIKGHNKNKTYDLSLNGVEAIMNISAGASVDDYCNPIGQHISKGGSIEFSCYVSPGFSGTITLQTPSYTDPSISFSNNPIQSDRVSDDIVVK